MAPSWVFLNYKMINVNTNEQKKKIAFLKPRLFFLILIYSFIEYRYDPEGCEDIEDLPIELRRLEDEQEAPGREVCPPPTTADRLSTHKSKSLSDIAITTLK